MDFNFYKYFNIFTTIGNQPKIFDIQHGVVESQGFEIFILLLLLLRFSNEDLNIFSL